MRFLREILYPKSDSFRVRMETLVGHQRGVDRINFRLEKVSKANLQILIKGGLIVLIIWIYETK